MLFEPTENRDKGSNSILVPLTTGYSETVSLAPVSHFFFLKESLILSQTRVVIDHFALCGYSLKQPFFQQQGQLSWVYSDNLIIQVFLS